MDNPISLSDERLNEIEVQKNPKKVLPNRMYYTYFFKRRIRVATCAECQPKLFHFVAGQGLRQLYSQGKNELVKNSTKLFWEKIWRLFQDVARPDQPEGDNVDRRTTPRLTFIYFAITEFKIQQTCFAFYSLTNHDHWSFPIIISNLFLSV